MNSDEIEAYLASIERRLTHLRTGGLSYEDWVEYNALFSKRAPRDLTWCLSYIRKLLAYTQGLERTLEAMAHPTEALTSLVGSSGPDPTMRDVRTRKNPTAPRMEAPTRTEDLPSGSDLAALMDAFDLTKKT